MPSANRKVFKKARGWQKCPTPQLFLNKFRILYASVLKFSVASFYSIWIKTTQKINVWPIPTPSHHALRNAGVPENLVVSLLRNAFIIFELFSRNVDFGNQF